MRKDLAAKLVTVIVILGAFGLVIARKMGLPATSAAPSSGASPQDAVYAMLDAARAGDTAAYVARYTGQMQASLRQAITEKGDAGFRSYLRTGNAEIKGVAVQEPKPVAANQVQVRVEYVYQDRNEAQDMLLERLADGWKIARVDNAERVKTLVPYGTPIQ